MEPTASLTVDDKTLKFPILTGTENEKAIDLRQLRSQTGYITFDDGYGNTGSCQSEITFIDGEKGILRHRGFPIEQLAASSTFIECAWLIIYGELPTRKQLSAFSNRVLSSARIDVGMDRVFEGFPHHSHPMAMLSSMLNTLGCYYSDLATNDREKDLERFDDAAALLLSKVRTLAAMAYRMKSGLPFIYPRSDMGYCQNFLHMMFSEPYQLHFPHDDVTKALDLIFLLHADHEQNCSTSTVRMVASGGANLFASVSAGVCALWGPLHGGANQAVIEMLEAIKEDGGDTAKFMEKAKDKNDPFRLMGFGHRVYKNFDPRAKIIKKSADDVLDALGVEDPVLDIAKGLEKQALEDDYFVQRKLYPNVDFYSGIIYRALGIPVDMFTVMFAVGRLPGWIAQWREMRLRKEPIGRPRQIYTGETHRKFKSIDNR